MCWPGFGKSIFTGARHAYIGYHPCVHEKYCAGMAVAEKESVSCPYPDEKTRRFPESRRRRDPFCRRRADSKSKAAVVVGKSVYILPGEHRLEMAGYTLRHQLSNIPSFPSKGKQQERTVRFTGGRRYILRYEPAGRKLEISDNGPI